MEEKTKMLPLTTLELSRGGQLSICELLVGYQHRAFCVPEARTPKYTEATTVRVQYPEAKSAGRDREITD